MYIHIYIYIYVYIYTYTDLYVLTHLTRPKKVKGRVAKEITAAVCTTANGGVYVYMCACI